MDNPISILFYLKRVKVNVHGLAPIFQRITINGRRLNNSIGKFVYPDKWQSEMSKMRVTSEEACLINGHLNNLKSQILNVEQNLIKKDIPVNFETFKKELTFKKNESEY